MIHPYHQQQQYNSHIMYEYRFSENRIERWPLAGSQTSYPYPNSAESNSPPAWESAGSSPEFLNLATCSRPVRPSSHRPQRTTSPVNSSVISPTRVTTMQRRSALRQHGQSSRRGPAKSVQWVSDIKKKPQEISSDRKIVKVQVKQHWHLHQKVSFNIASEASYVYILSGPLKVPKMVQFGQFLKTWSLWSKSVTRQSKNWRKMPKFENSNATFWIIFKHCVLS